MFADAVRPLLCGESPHSDLHPVVGVIMEGLGRQMNHLIPTIMTNTQRQQSSYLSLGYDIESQFLVHNAGSSLGEVALVGDQATPTETARAADLVHPLGPLGIQGTVRLLILWFEYSDIFLHKDHIHKHMARLYGHIRGQSNNVIIVSHTCNSTEVTTPPDTCALTFCTFRTK